MQEKRLLRESKKELIISFLLQRRTHCKGPALEEYLRQLGKYLLKDSPGIPGLSVSCHLIFCVGYKMHDT